MQRDSISIWGKHLQTNRKNGHGESYCSFNGRRLHKLGVERSFFISRAYARGGGVQTSPIGMSTKMHIKENITFLALLSLLFCNDMDSNMI